jgi:hypothetical protein
MMDDWDEENVGLDSRIIVLDESKTYIVASGLRRKTHSLFDFLFK